MPDSFVLAPLSCEEYFHSCVYHVTAHRYVGGLNKFDLQSGSQPIEIQLGS